MNQRFRGPSGHEPEDGDLVEIDLNFASMRRFQAEFSPNLSKDGLFIDTGEPLDTGSVVRFRVILPEEFIFLEGTAVVEWARSAEAMGEGVPGMALRFVTLSPQNHELVEQLVQNFIDRGGVPFDLYYQPTKPDLPTDALEAPPRPPVQAAGGGAGEAFRLTIRGTEPNPAMAAMQALREVVPSDGPGAGEALDRDTEAAPGDVEKVHGFEIVSVSATLREIEDHDGAESPTASANDDELVWEDPSSDPPVGGDDAGGDGTEETGEPPDLDWSDEGAGLVERSGDQDGRLVEAAGTASPAEGFELEVEEGPDDDAEQAEPPFLNAPDDFDDGPELVDDSGEGESVGGPAFDVSFPQPDDEPDTTPVMPDDGDLDFVVGPTGDGPEPRRRRGRLAAALVVVVLIVVAGVFAWPRVRGWVAERGAGQPEAAIVGTDRAEIDPAEIETVDSAPAVGAPATDSDSQADGTDEPVVVDSEIGDDAGDLPETATDPETAPEPAEVVQPADDVEAAESRAEPAPLSRADTVVEIGFVTRESATVVTIRGNGSLENGAISLSPLPSPPRILIRVSGITNTFRPYNIEASTAELATIRTGLHEEKRPPELWVVLDLADPMAAVAGVDIRDDTVRLTIARP